MLVLDRRHLRHLRRPGGVLMRRLIRWIDQEGRISLGVEPRAKGQFHAIVGTDDPMRLLQGESFPVGQTPVTLVDDVSLELGDGLTLLLPWDPPEVWCAGVTYRRSRDARMAESSVEDVYDLVYDGEPARALPQGRRRQAHGRAVRADRDPRRLDVERARGRDRPRRRRAGPDPRVHDRQRRLLPRDRRRQPALPSQAKIYAGACAVGPSLYVPLYEPSRVPARHPRHRRRTARSRTRTARRRPRWSATSRSSSTWLVKENPVPPGTLLLTGTGLVPDDEFTLAARAVGRDPRAGDRHAREPGRARGRARVGSPGMSRSRGGQGRKRCLWSV